ncbi:MAG: hypothetical protein ACHQK9_16310 [Reyranellales bacterium]
MFFRTCLVLMVLALPGPSFSVAAQPVAAPDCTVDGTLAANDGLKLDLTYRCRSTAALVFQAGGDRAAGKVLDFRDGAGRPPTPSSNGWPVEPVAGLVEAHYRFDLTGFARAADSPSIAVQRGEGVLALLGAWLLEPRGYDRAPVIDIRIAPAAGLSFATGLPKVGDAWRLSGTNVRFAGYSALGRFALKDIAVPAPGSLRPGQTRQDGVLRLAILDGISDAGRGDLIDWVQRTVEAEAHYWQGFTARQMLVGVIPMVSQRGVGYGRTVSGGGASIMIEVSPSVEKRRLFNDWVLVHEIVHTGMPYVRPRASWFMEGAATYVEPIIRARAGWKSEEEVWKEWVDNMPQGESAFALGLANASGRQNYWAGAIFMLMADIGIRRATAGAKGLEDCLGGALWSGLDAPQRVSVEEYAAACDRVTGSTVMSALVDRHFTRGRAIDLGALWKDLGVSQVGGRIVLDNSAPSAQWRKMIVMGNPDHPPKHVKLPWES